jgi:tetratricopeptide (TPR) repeat protein
MKKLLFVILSLIFLLSGLATFAQAQKVPDIPAGTAEEYFNRGNQFRQQGNLEQAISDYTHAIRVYSKHAKAYYNRGNAYGKLGKIDEAIADYKKAVEINPRYTEAYYNLGNSYEKQGNLDLAISGYTRAIETNPKYAPAYCNRGNVYQAKGNLQQALSDYNTAVDLNPNFAGVYSNRGNVYQAQGNLQQAINDYNKAIEINPSFAGFYSNRGNIYQMQGNLQQAIADYNKAIERNPNDSSSFYNRGLAYYGIEEYGRSLADYTTAASQNPNKEAYDDFIKYYPAKKETDTLNVRADIINIFGEKLGLGRQVATPVVAAAPVAPVATASAAQAELTESSGKESVRASVDKWLESWLSGDMNTYRGSYDAATFRSQGMNLDGWIKYKNNVWRNSKDINVQIEDVQISTEKEFATVVFTQRYSSSILQDKGKKTLQLRKIGNDWKIYRETWSKM